MLDAELLLAHVDLARFKGTFLGDLDDDSRREFLGGATVFEVDAGAPFFPDGPRIPRLGIIFDGTARTFLTADDGRQLTVRYVRSGGMVSSVSGVRGAQVPVGVEALTACVVLEFPIQRTSELARSDVRIAVAIAAEIGRRLEATYATLHAVAFAPTRERMAMQLLEVAHAGPDGGLVAALTQQGLADSVGTVREVIARILREFREEGIVATRPGGVVILDPDRLVAIAGRWRTPARLHSASSALDSSAFLDANPDAVVAIDRAGTIVYANPSVHATFGWQPEELVGQPVEVLLPTSVRPLHRAHMDRFFAKPTARPMGIGRVLRGRRADGAEFPVEISLAPVNTKGGLAVFATIVDISYRAELREAVGKARLQSGSREMSDQPVTGAT